MLVAEGLRKRYRAREVVHDFGLTLDAGEGKTRVKWSSTFDADGAPDDKAKEAILGIYDAGLGKLSAIFRN